MLDFQQKVENPPSYFQSTTFFNEVTKMPHLLSFRNNGTAELAFAGALPWHGLGQRIDPNASIEAWQTAAGLDWQILEAPVQYRTQDGALTGAPDFKVLFRSDTLDPLSVVGEGFKPVQPGEVLEFFRDITELGGMQLHTAGSLKGGRKLWALAKNGIQGEVVPRDSVRGNLLLATAADGSLATTCCLTAVRVVCANTLRIALNERNPQVKVNHRSKFDAATVKAQLGAIDGAFGRFLSDMRELAHKRLSPEQARELLNDLLGRPMKAEEIKPVVSGEDHLRALLTGSPLPAAKPAAKDEKRAVEKIMTLYQGQGMGSRADGVYGTAWGLMNAVSQYTDHQLGRTADSRMDSAWFGRGDALKSEFQQLLMKV